MAMEWLMMENIYKVYVLFLHQVVCTNEMICFRRYGNVIEDICESKSVCTWISDLFGNTTLNSGTLSQPQKPKKYGLAENEKKSSNFLFLLRHNLSVSSCLSLISESKQACYLVNTGVSLTCLQAAGPQ